jgi:cell division protein FtsI/penicillin-binding protein 2
MKIIERRIGLLFAGFLVCFLVIVCRAFWLQGVQGAQLASEAISQQTQSIPLPSLRGSLLDRHGNALVASEDAATIFAVPPEVKKPALAAEKLATILKLPQNKVLGEVTAERTAPSDRDRPGSRQPPHLPAGRYGRAGARLRRRRKRGPDRARGRRGIGAGRNRW